MQCCERSRQLGLASPSRRARSRAVRCWFPTGLCVTGIAVPASARLHQHEFPRGLTAAENMGHYVAAMRGLIGPHADTDPRSSHAADFVRSIRLKAAEA